MVVVDTLQVDLKLDTSAFKQQSATVLKNMTSFAGTFQHSLQAANGSVGKIIKNTAKLTNGIKGSLAGFDQINLVTQKIAKIAGGSGGKKGSGGKRKSGGSKEKAEGEEVGFLPTLNPAPIREAVGWMGQLQSSFQTFRGWLDENMPVIYGLLAGTGIGALLAFSAENFIPAVSAFVGFLSGNPLVVFVTTLAAIAAGMVSAALNMDDFRGKVAGFTAQWREDFAGVLVVVGAMWDSFITHVGEPLMAAFGAAFSSLWQGHLEPFFTNVMNFISAVSGLVKMLFETIVQPGFEFLMSQVGPLLIGLFGRMGEAVGKVIGEIMDMAAGLVESLTGVITFLTGVFSANWSKAWEGLRMIVSGIINATPKLFKDAVNVVIDYLNRLLSKVQRVFDSVRAGVNEIANLLGFEGMGRISVPKIPRLAAGGVVTQPTLALVGEAGPEAVVPLGDSQRYLGGSEAMAPVIYEAAMLVVAAIEQKDTKLVFDSQQAASSLYPALQREKSRLGMPAITYR